MSETKEQRQLREFLNFMADHGFWYESDDEAKTDMDILREMFTK